MNDRPRDRASFRSSPTAGFTLIELTVVLGLIGLMTAFVMPRLSVLTSAALDTNARRLATRVQFLREEASLRNHWIRLSVNPARGSYRAERLVPVAGGAAFSPVDEPLYREITVPHPLRLSVEGPGVGTTLDGYHTTVFAPDGYADPAILWLEDGGGRRLAVLIDPVSPRARILDDTEVRENRIGAPR